MNKETAIGPPAFRQRAGSLSTISDACVLQLKTPFFLLCARVIGIYCTKPHMRNASVLQVKTSFSTMPVRDCVQLPKGV